MGTRHHCYFTWSNVLEASHLWFLSVSLIVWVCSFHVSSCLPLLLSLQVSSPLLSKCSRVVYVYIYVDPVTTAVTTAAGGASIISVILRSQDHGATGAVLVHLEHVSVHCEPGDSNMDIMMYDQSIAHTFRVENYARFITPQKKHVVGLMYDRAREICVLRFVPRV